MGSDRGVETLQAVRYASTRDEATELHIEQERACASKNSSTEISAATFQQLAQQYAAPLGKIAGGGCLVTGVAPLFA